VLEGIYHHGNCMEASLWILFALGLGWRSILPSPPHATLSRWVVPIFTLFGLSDLVEVHTGEWWKPGWLLLW